MIDNLKGKEMNQDVVIIKNFHKPKKKKFHKLPKRVELECSYKKKKINSEVIDVLINSVGRILSHCIRMSNHHNVHFKSPTISYINYTSIKLKLKRNF